MMAKAPAPDLSEFPDAFPASSENAQQRYRRSATHFAVHDDKPRPGATSELKSEKIAIYPIGRLADFPMSARRTPVYTLQPGGKIAVPTGRVFVRLAPKERLRDHAESFRKAGYDIVETVSYAPNAGWLRAANSSMAAALSGLHRLAELPAVENVEPQMLAEMAQKN